MLLVKSASNKTEEMAAWLWAHDAFPEAPGLIPSPHMVAPNTLYSSSRESEAFFLPPWAPGTYVMHRKTYKQNVHAHKIKKPNSKTKRTKKRVTSRVGCWFISSRKITFSEQSSPGKSTASHYIPSHPAIGYSVPRSQSWDHIHTGSIMWTEQLYLGIWIYVHIFIDRDIWEIARSKWEGLEEEKRGEIV